MDRPLVSIVIPCYNQAHFLRQAVQSCLDQDYRPIEVIVVNDGSGDDTSEVARSFGEPVRLLEQPNTGLSGARNAGIAAAGGAFVAILDSDDFLLPGMLARRMHFFEREEVGLVGGAILMTDEDGRVVERYVHDALPPEWEQHRHIVRRNYTVTCGCLLRRRAFQLCGTYDPLLRSCEDWDQNIRVAQRYRLAYDPEPGACYRQVQGSMSRNYVRMYDSAVQVMRKNRPFARSRMQFMVDSFIGLSNHTRGIMVAKLLAAHPRNEAIAIMARTLIQRPMMILHFAPIVPVAIWNRLMRIFGRGPLARTPARTG